MIFRSQKIVDVVPKCGSKYLTWVIWVFQKFEFCGSTRYLLWLFRSKIRLDVGLAKTWYVWCGSIINLMCLMWLYKKLHLVDVGLLKTVYKWMFLYIFHKTEVPTVILRCLTGLNLDWVKSYGLRCSLRPHASSANSKKIATDK